MNNKIELPKIKIMETIQIVALKTIGVLTGFVIGFLTGIGIQTLIDKLINL